MQNRIVLILRLETPLQIREKKDRRFACLFVNSCRINGLCPNGEERHGTSAEEEREKGSQVKPEIGLQSRVNEIRSKKINE